MFCDCENVQLEVYEVIIIDVIAILSKQSLFLKQTQPKYMHLILKVSTVPLW